MDEGEQQGQEKRKQLLLRGKKRIKRLLFGLLVPWSLGHLVIATVEGQRVHEEGEKLEDCVVSGQTDQDVHKTCLLQLLF